MSARCERAAPSSAARPAPTAAPAIVVGRRHRDAPTTSWPRSASSSGPAAPGSGTTRSHSTDPAAPPPVSRTPIAQLVLARARASADATGAGPWRRRVSAIAGGSVSCGCPWVRPCVRPAGVDRQDRHVERVEALVALGRERQRARPDLHRHADVVGGRRKRHGVRGERQAGGRQRLAEQRAELGRQPLQGLGPGLAIVRRGVALARGGVQPGLAQRDVDRAGTCRPASGSAACSRAGSSGCSRRRSGRARSSAGWRRPSRSRPCLRRRCAASCRRCAAPSGCRSACSWRRSGRSVRSAAPGSRSSRRPCRAGRAGSSA